MSNRDKWRAQSWTNRLLLVEAYAFLGLMRAMILVIPFRQILRLFGLIAGSNGDPLSLPMTQQAARIGWAVRAAAAHTPWHSTCLAQALCGMTMLRRRKMKATLYLGIAKHTSLPQKKVAHAWLYCGGATLTGAEEKERCVMLASFTFF
jgi:hypothetical protein